MTHRIRRTFVGLLAFALLCSTPAWASYTDKTVHESGKHNTYKHPNQKSYTGPFDYAPLKTSESSPAPSTGKCNCFTFDATKSNDLDGQKLTVSWDLGDGTTSDKPVFTHCYEKAGDYKVALTVRDSSGMVCDSGYANVNVSANFPATISAGEDKRACLGESVSFTADTNASSASPRVVWDFGDGQTGEGSSVSHSYEKPGTYRVRVSVDDGKNTDCSTAADSLTVTINDRADVRLSGSEATCVGRTVRFDAQGTGGKYTWDFGDGQTWVGGSSANHAYQKGGTYTVRVTLDNGRGEACSAASDSHTIRVNANPVANAGDNIVCCVGEVNTFDASKTTNPGGRQLTYLWNFGDGNTATGEKVTHVYEKSGNYRISLTVSDDSGSECGSSSDSFVADVNTKPSAVIQVR